MALALGFSMFFSQVSKAQVGGLTDFGGFVMAIVPCTCSAGVWTLIVNPNPQNASLSGPYLWSLITPPNKDDILLLYPFIGMSLLGKTNMSGEQCQMNIGLGCITLPVRASIDMYTGKGIQPIGS